LSDALISAINDHEFEPSGLAVGSLSQVLAFASRCALDPSLPSEIAAHEALSEPGSRAGLDESRARAILADHADAIATMLAAMKVKREAAKPCLAMATVKSL
jgi:hypothetical protein